MALDAYIDVFLLLVKAVVRADAVLRSEVEELAPLLLLDVHNNCLADTANAGDVWLPLEQPLVRSPPQVHSHKHSNSHVRRMPQSEWP